MTVRVRRGAKVPPVELQTLTALDVGKDKNAAGRGIASDEVVALQTAPQLEAQGWLRGQPRRSRFPVTILIDGDDPDHGVVRWQRDAALIVCL